MIKPRQNTKQKRSGFLRNRQRNSRGFSFAEIGASSVFIIFLVIVSLDMWFLLIAAPINDAACRDAARAAAQGADSTTAGNLAASAISARQNQSSMFIQPPKIINFTYQDFQGNPPPNTTPYVSVTTQSQVTPIIPLSVFGSMIIGGQTINFTQTYTYPIVRTKTITQQ
jgi:hypothetical protein